MNRQSVSEQHRTTAVSVAHRIAVSSARRGALSRLPKVLQQALKSWYDHFFSRRGRLSEMYE